jgi:hypothetical protein
MDMRMQQADVKKWLVLELTPWSRVLPEKLTRPKLLKKFAALCGTRRFITVFTRACHPQPDEARPCPLFHVSKFKFNVIFVFMLACSK